MAGKVRQLVRGFHTRPLPGPRPGQRVADVLETDDELDKVALAGRVAAPADPHAK
jgi:hypothetical protein